MKFTITLIFSFLISFSNIFADEKKDVYKYLNLFGEAFEKIKNNYVEEVEVKELIESAIQGMLNSLDPHSTFLNSDELNELKVQTKGEFGGLGIEVTLENGFVKVISPIDDTPAFKVGIKAGDFIKFASHSKVYMIVSNVQASSNASTLTIEPPLLTALTDDSVVTYDNVPFTVHLTNDIQEFGVAGADKDGALLYQFEFDVEESL